MLAPLVRHDDHSRHCPPLHRRTGTAFRRGHPPPAHGGPACDAARGCQIHGPNFTSSMIAGSTSPSNSKWRGPRTASHQSHSPVNKFVRRMSGSVTISRRILLHTSAGSLSRLLLFRVWWHSAFWVGFHTGTYFSAYGVPHGSASNLHDM